MMKMNQSPCAVSFGLNILNVSSFLSIADCAKSPYYAASGWARELQPDPKVSALAVLGKLPVLLLVLLVVLLFCSTLHPKF